MIKTPFPDAEIFHFKRTSTWSLTAHHFNISKGAISCAIARHLRHVLADRG